jgi:uncharacterized 2Fe-2S/4Fe-4S cluster protein (DUF4445 family)
MPVVVFSPSGKSISVEKGSRLADAARALGIRLPAPCGGKGLCGKCRVLVTGGEAPADARQRACLSGDRLAGGWRATCVLPVDGDLVVADPEAEGGDAILTDFTAREIRRDSGMWEREIELASPSPQDQEPDAARLLAALAKRGIGDGVGKPALPLPILRRLPDILRENCFKCRVIGMGDVVLDVRAPGDRAPAAGLAVDIGTTTIAAALCDLFTLDILAVSSAANPQARHGDDVISRIDYAARGAGERDEMRALVVQTLAALAVEAEKRAGFSARPLFAAIAGNTAMTHLLLGVPAQALALAPFIPVFRSAGVVDTGRLGWAGDAPPPSYIVPGVSAYVGGDITAGLLAHDVCRTGKRTLFLDVGTNGEIALAANGKIYACAAAAGPAFEGARISRGMRAAAGAIARVGVAADGDLDIGTIDSVLPAKGLCGTGLLDAIATLIRTGVVDETGRMLEPEEALEARPDLGEKIAARIRETPEGCAFRLAGSPSGGDELLLTQTDVREFQLAKGAIAAGCRVLLDIAGVRTGDLDAVLLAGGFGNYLDPGSAIAAGLLPAGIKPDRIRSIGNASLAGARMCLLSRFERAEAEALIRAVEYVELSGRDDFQTAFAEEMLFPEVFTEPLVK